MVCKVSIVECRWPAHLRIVTTAIGYYWLRLITIEYYYQLLLATIDYYY